MKFVVLSPDQRAKAFFEDKSSAPPTAIAITDELWAQWIVNTGGYVYQPQTQTLSVAPPSTPAPTIDDLLSAAIAIADKIQGGGVTLAVAGAAGSIAVQCSTTTQYLTLLFGASQRAALNAARTLNWEQRDGSSVTLDAAQTQELALGVADWLQSIWDVRVLHVQPAIVAGKIADVAQIMDPTSVGLPPWPANS